MTLPLPALPWTFPESSAERPPSPVPGWDAVLFPRLFVVALRAHTALQLTARWQLDPNAWLLIRTPADASRSKPGQPYVVTDEFLDPVPGPAGVMRWPVSREAVLTELSLRGARPLILR